MIYCYREEDADSNVGNDDTFVTVILDHNICYTLERFVESCDDAPEPFVDTEQRFGDEEGQRALFPFLRGRWELWLLAMTVLMCCLSTTFRWVTTAAITVVVGYKFLPPVAALWSQLKYVGRLCGRFLVTVGNACKEQACRPSPIWRDLNSCLSSHLKSQSQSQSHRRRRLRSVGPIDHFVRIVKTVCDVCGVDFVRWASRMCLVLFVFTAMAGVMCLMFQSFVQPSSLHESVMPDTPPSPPALNSTINITLLEPSPPTLLEPSPPTLNNTINVTIDEEPTSPPAIAAPSPTREGLSSSDDVPELVDCPSYLPIIIEKGAAIE
mmetsp:Transcript_29150/g.70269  ORF Transcript_29150/g.70269 Transcript_29150/m.70269 type:complete len:323 (-) Transcript_29150:2019-2987(-)|eukprot:CAMPEP_0113476678 /NCGR_PEP_ID=MMETSP0014_2-20120614/19796_1 /TAXON_ID=2857 /ORGANISM="Nitzschia sp." /LENGTH=322 /DNA_ID=CAMNT_0000369709 /DNA_START=540 /DNA_END=1508 /DNA_ORIENTATION=+ /assembly_acc=CAM_ASM_000159